jgi:hypothetical protein
MATIPKMAVSQLEIWAKDAGASDKERPDQANITDGWAYTQRPPAKFFNWILWIISYFIAYINEKGVPEWDSLTEYYPNSIVQVSGVLWVAIGFNSGSSPSTINPNWRPFTADVGTRILTINSVTPSVLNGRSWKTANTTATTITGLVDGVEGQKISIICNDAFTTIAGALTKTGMTIPLIVGDIMEWTHNGTTFKQTGGNVGMGNKVIIAPNVIGDLPLISVTSPTVVDLSDDGVRKGASSVTINVLMGNSGVATDLRIYIRDNGNTVIQDELRMANIALVQGNIESPLDKDAKVQIWFNGNGTTAIGYVKSYTI